MLAEIIPVEVNLAQGVATGKQVAVVVSHARLVGDEGVW